MSINFLIGRTERKMKIKIIGFLVFLLLFATCFLQVDAKFNIQNTDIINTNFKNQPVVEWEKHFKGTSWAHVVRQIDDGFIVVGATDVDDTGDGLVMKVDNSGNEIWNKTFPNSAFEGLCVTSDNGYIVSGWQPTENDTSGIIVKLEEDGTVEWEDTYGETYGTGIIQVQQTSEGYYIGAGWNHAGGGGGDGWLINVDSDGNELWNKTYGTETTRDSIHSIYVTDNNGYILPGWNTNSSNKFSDSWVVKTDEDGVVEWEKTLGTGQDIFGVDKFDQLNMGNQALDGGYIFTGYTGNWFLYYLAYMNNKLRLVKTDAEGNIEWDQTYGGLLFNWGLWCEPTSDGGYIVSGSRYGYGRIINLIQSGSTGLRSCQLWVFKTDSDGNIEWDYTMRDGTARCVQETDDGGYIIAGHKGPYYGTTGILLIKLDSESN
jgi:hypothetical protein